MGFITTTMIASKYPVTYKNTTFRVDIEEDSIIGSDVYLLNVKLCEYVDKNFLWKKYKGFNLSYTYSTGWDYGKKWNGRYVQLVEMVVEKYMDEIKQSSNNKCSHLDGLLKFKNWNGEIIPLGDSNNGK